MSASNGGIWISFAPLAGVLNDYYDWSPAMVNSLFQAFYIGYALLSLPTVWATVELRLGLQWTVHAAAAMNLGAALLRCFGSHSTAYVFCFLGNVVGGMAGAMFLGSPPNVSQAWFGDSERGKASSLAICSNQGGLALGFAIASLAVTSGSDLEAWNVSQAIFAGICFVFVLLFFRNAPATPPSSSAKADAVPIIKALHMLKKDRNFWFMNIMGGAYLGFFFTFSSILAQELAHSGFDNVQTAVAGSLYMAVGTVAMIGVGELLDRTHAYRTLLIGAAWASAALLLLFTLTSHVMGTVALTAVLILMGVTMSALFPLIIESAVEMCWPAPESTICGVFMLTAQLFGICQTFLANALHKGEGNYNDFNFLFIGFLVVFAISTYLFFRGSYRRFEYEQSKASGGLLVNESKTTAEQT